MASDLELLLVGAAPDTASHAMVLRQHYRSVNVTGHQRTAIEYLHRGTHALMVAGVSLEGGPLVDICREAKSRPSPPSVLITAERPEDAPDLLAAGCDGILLKPFTPNLLVNRISRLLRARAAMLKIGTNRVWPSTGCPYCSHQGVMSFDYASMRRAWYACLECRNVWMAKRLDC